MIKKAQKFAERAHKDQTRKFTGEPYYFHCNRVASLLSKFTSNKDIICAGFLHDVLEDTSVQSEEIEYEFNMVVAAYVEEVTNLYTKEKYSELPRSQRKIQECIRLGKISEFGKLLKLCDRLDNVLDMKKSCPDDYSYYIKESRELLEVLRGVNPGLEKLLEIALV
jgi:(p)ppGpp synthase/HD superfamily hydrolase